MNYINHNKQLQTTLCEKVTDLQNCSHAKSVQNMPAQFFRNFKSIEVAR